MQIEILKEFVALAQTLNYRVASEQLFITQPTLSKHMKMLETQIGAQLFERNTKSVTITRDGAEFLERAIKICDLYDDAIRATRHEGVGHIRMGVPLLYQFYHDLARAFVARLEREIPDVRVAVEDIGLSGEPVEFLEKGCDLVLVFDPSRYSTGDVAAFPLCEHRLNLWVSYDNPLAQRESVSIVEVDGMVYRPSSPDARYIWRETARSLFHEHGVTPIVGDAADAFYQLGPQDFAIIFGGRPNATLGYNVKQVPLKEDISETICATYRKSHDSSLLQRVLEMLRCEAVRLAAEEE